MIASGSDKGKIIVHNVTDGAVLKEINIRSCIYSIAYSRDGSILAIGCSDGKCRVFDTLNWELLNEIEHPDSVMTVQFTENNWIVIGCWDGVIRTYNATYEQVEY